MLGGNHPFTVVGYNNLAGVYESQGEHEKAEELYGTIVLQGVLTSILCGMGVML